MRTTLEILPAIALALLAGVAGAQTDPADMGRAGAAARAAAATQDARMGAAAVTIPRGASMPPMGAAPESLPQPDAGASPGALSAQAPVSGGGSSQDETRAGPRLMWGTPSAADAGLRRGQCPAGTIRRNQGCMPAGRHAPAY